MNVRHLRCLDGTDDLILTSWSVIITAVMNKYKFTTKTDIF